MTAPQHSHRRHCSPLQTALWSVVCLVSSETDDDVSKGWIVTQRAQTHWRASRVVTATHLIIRRQMITAGTVSIDDDGQRCRSLADLLSYIDAAFAAGSAGLAERLEVTPRRTQQNMAAAIERAAKGILIILAGVQVGGV